MRAVAMEMIFTQIEVALKTKKSASIGDYLISMGSFFNEKIANLFYVSTFFFWIWNFIINRILGVFLRTLGGKKNEPSNFFLINWRGKENYLSAIATASFFGEIEITNFRRIGSKFSNGNSWNSKRHRYRFAFLFILRVKTVVDPGRGDTRPIQI